ncbi:aminopeptidase [Candidatus Woesearchaeota archaeon]|jgi:aminopeptidase|nr:aminopeptidase [Candidatus Woesearchaeota archaeon]
MTDPRIKQFADILVNYSTRIKKNDNVLIIFDSNASPLALECYKLALKNKAIVRLKPNLPNFQHTFLKYAGETALTKTSKVDLLEAKETNKIIRIGGEYNTREFSNISNDTLSKFRKSFFPIKKIWLKNDWVLTKFPTNALAQDAEMSLEEYEDFVFSAVNVDWNKMKVLQKKIKQRLDSAKQVRIIGKNTDISFSIKDRPAVMCYGQCNMPDGEVYVCPLEKTTQGFIEYSFPAIYEGKEVEGIKLEFKDGKVIKATATKNQTLLTKMINIDSGAKYLGEFGIGLNFGITQFTKQILFDEKIGGTIHLALGMSFEDANGTNKSMLHWDMIKDMREQGEIYLDGKLFQKNGKF